MPGDTLAEGAPPTSRVVTDRNPDRIGVSVRVLAIVAAVIAVLWIVAVPALNNVLKYDDPIKPGERMQLAPGLTFAPPPGWNLEAGLRTTDRPRTEVEDNRAIIADGTVEATVTPIRFDGTPKELLKVIERGSMELGRETLTATGERLHLPARGAERRGVVEHYAAPSSEGLAGAFVFGRTGVAVRVVGSPAAMSDRTEAIGRMLTSFAYHPAGGPDPGDGK